MNASSDDAPNHDQETYWNDHAGRTWVAMQPKLDVQLRPLGFAAMERLALAEGMRVLDVGCGAGDTTLELATRVVTGSALGVDISAALLERARARAEGHARVRFELADAQTFPFEPASFDALFSRFGVMFFADPVAAFGNLRTAVKPGGRMAFTCWRAMSENPTFTLPLAAALSLLPEPPSPPAPGAPGPFAFADGARTKALVEQAGWVDVEVWAHDAELLVGGGAAHEPGGPERGLDAAVEMAMHVGPLGRALLALDDATRARAREAVREALRPHDGPNGVTLPSAIWVVTARAPLPQR